MEYLIGLDTGTTHVKAGLFQLNGTVVAMEIANTQTVYLGEGRAVYDPEDVWRSVASILRKLTSTLTAKDRLLGLSIASMGEAGLLLDKRGRHLTPIIAWFDARGKEMLPAWADGFGEERTYAITGLSLNYIYSLLKILWLQKNEPAAMAAARTWLCMPDYIGYQLSGAFATDYSIASRTMAFAVKERRWSPEILEFAEVDASLLPPAYPSGTIIGEVTESASEATGLPAGVPVVTGGHDHICGALAVGVTSTGKILNSMGTADTLVASFDELPVLDVQTMQGFNVGCHVARDTYYMQGGLDSGGLSIEWFRTHFATTEQQEAAKQGIHIYQAIMEEAARAPLGCQGLMFVPHLRGSSPPQRDPAGRAAFVGIRDYHERAHFFRAIFEGNCYELKLIMNRMEQNMGACVERVSGIGGGVKNDLWMQIRAAVTGKLIEVPAVPDATLLGAALLAGIGVGVYADEREAVAATYQRARTWEPDGAQVGAYNDYVERYARLLPLVRQISHIAGDTG